MNKWTFEICNQWHIIWSTEYQLHWNNLLAHSPNAHVFFTPALVKAWVATYLPLRQLEPIFIWGKMNDNEVFFPFVLWKKNWKNAFMKSIVPAGYSDFDYHDPIFKQVTGYEDIQLFWDGLDAVLRVYSSDEILIDGLHDFFIPLHFKQCHSEPCPYIPLPFTQIEDFKNNLDRKLRQDINRRQRKAIEKGTLEYINYTDKNLKQAIDILPMMLELHSQRWPNAYKAPLFHEHLIREGLQAGIIHFSQINIDHSPISWRIGFKYKNKFYSYMPTINPEFKDLSPGKLHLIYCIEQAIMQRVDVYDQLRGSELYKSEWTTHHDTIYNVRKDSTTIISRIKHSLMKLRKVIQ